MEMTSYILLWIGRQGVDLYNSFTWEADTDKTMPEKIWQKFEKHLAPRTNFRLARYQLQLMRQQADENTDDFMSRCRNQAAKCRFRDQQEIDERLIEQLIIGTKHKKAQERILEKADPDLALDQAIDLARTYEATLQHVAQLHSESDANIHVIRKSGTGNGNKKCRNCGTSHEPLRCPAFGSLCDYCSKRNHWSRVCLKKERESNKGSTRNESNAHARDSTSYMTQSNTRQRPRQSRNINTVQRDENEFSDEQFDTLVFETITIDSIHPAHDINKPNRDEVIVDLNVQLPQRQNSTTVLKAKLDTGAQGNILPLRLYREMFPDNIGPGGNRNQAFLHSPQLF